MKRKYLPLVICITVISSFFLAFTLNSRSGLLVMGILLTALRRVVPAAVRLQTLAVILLAIRGAGVFQDKEWLAETFVQTWLGCFTTNTIRTSK
jgi:hypothetical protein